MSVDVFDTVLQRLAERQGVKLEELRSVVRCVREMNPSLSDLEMVAILLGIAPQGGPCAHRENEVLLADIEALRKDNANLREQVQSLTRLLITTPLPGPSPTVIPMPAWPQPVVPAYPPVYPPVQPWAKPWWETTIVTATGPGITSRPEWIVGSIPPPGSFLQSSGCSLVMGGEVKINAAS